MMCLPMMSDIGHCNAIQGVTKIDPSVKEQTLQFLSRFDNSLVVEFENDSMITTQVAKPTKKPVE